MVTKVKTVGIDLWAGQMRGAVENRATVMFTAPRVQQPPRDLFVRAYERFAATCRAVDEPGLAVIAVDEITGRASGLVTLRARVARHVASIIGRHDACDLFLPNNSELALRHLAIVLDPVQSWSKDQSTVRYRVLDLRTQTGFHDENDRLLRGLRCDGPALLRCGGYVLFVLPLGDRTDWPEKAEDAWAMLPERVYFDELERCPESSIQLVPHNQMGPTTRRSMIMATPGPRDSSDSLVMWGAPDHAGTFEIYGRQSRGALSLAHDALRDGVLIGRYARCDGAGLLDDQSLSRVHLLLLHTDDALLAIDTASRNGSRLYGQPNARVISITGDTELALGSKTTARWRWSAS
jgi:hypothetical protein